MSDSANDSLADAIRAKALELGFTRVGITDARPSQYRDYFRQWLDSGQAGQMHYLHNRFEERTHPATYFPSACSIICVAANYYWPLTDEQRAEPSGKIARYALGDDYHVHLKGKLHVLADWIQSQAPGCSTKCAVDTAPVMEKELAARAGVGWIGKNTCVMHETVGSWLLLGEILTTLDLTPDAPATDHCGTCTRCLDACPTGAITAPYQLDATKCISYLTIEAGDAPIHDTLQSQLGDWLFGCDICQDVCPFNRREIPATDEAFRPRFPDGRVTVSDVMSWQVGMPNPKLRGSAIKRVKLPVLQMRAKQIATIR